MTAEEMTTAIPPYFCGYTISEIEASQVLIAWLLREVKKHSSCDHVSLTIDGDRVTVGPPRWTMGSVLGVPKESKQVEQK